VDELSAAPSVLAPLKYLIRRLKLSDTRELAAFALESESATEILARSTALAQRVAPSLFDTKK
jgi:phosphoenolpyruvate-protein kinase (PTS system EI component)